MRKLNEIITIINKTEFKSIEFASNFDEELDDSLSKICELKSYAYDLLSEKLYEFANYINACSESIKGNGD